MSKQLKDKKIIIYKAIDRTTDISNKRVLGYYPIHSSKIWAYARQLSANEIYKYNLVLEDNNIEFIINYRAGLKPQDLYILYKNNWYDVTGVDYFEGNKGDVKLLAQTAKGGHANIKNKLMDYDPEVL